MAFFRRSTTTEKADISACLDGLLTKTKTLASAVEPDSAKIGYIGAGLIGAKVKNVRQSLDQTTSAIQTAAKEHDGHLPDEEANVLYDFFKGDMLQLLETILHRCSVVHHQRFRDLSVGGVVEMALGWFVSSFGALHTAMEHSINNAEILDKVKPLDERILNACETALRTHQSLNEK